MLIAPNYPVRNQEKWFFILSLTTGILPTKLLRDSCFTLKTCGNKFFVFILQTSESILRRYYLLGYLLLAGISLNYIGIINYGKCLYWLSSRNLRDVSVCFWYRM